VWPAADSLSALSPRPDAARRPGPGDLPGASPGRDDLPQNSAGRKPAAELGQHARWEPTPSAEQPLSPSGTILPDLPRPRPANRPSLAAKLSLADLARVRQALTLLSEQSATAAGPTDGDADRPVPSSRTFDQGTAALAADRADEDESDTVPMPVILHGATNAGSSGAVEASARAPFEPAQPSQLNGQSVPETPEDPIAADSLPAAAAAKLDQIKDLLLTAEAIGEDNLDQHFERVSQRQRELIREFFDQAVPGRDTPA